MISWNNTKSCWRKCASTCPLHFYISISSTCGSKTQRQFWIWEHQGAVSSSKLWRNPMWKHLRDSDLTFLFWIQLYVIDLLMFCAQNVMCAQKMRPIYYSLFNIYIIRNVWYPSDNFERTGVSDKAVFDVNKTIVFQHQASQNRLKVAICISHFYKDNQVIRHNHEYRL